MNNLKKLLAYVFIFVVSISSLFVYAEGEVKEVDRTEFMAGSTLKLDNKINGINFVVANDLIISNEQDYIFAAGNNVTLSGAKTKDAFVAGAVISVNDSHIRDLYVAGESVTIKNTPARNIMVYGATVIIDSTIEGNVTVYADKLTVTKDAVISGTLKYSGDTKVDIAGDAVVAKTKKMNINSSEVGKPSTKSIIKAHIVSLIGLIVFAFLAFQIFRLVFNKIDEIEKSGESLLKKAGLGFVYLICVPIVMIILLIIPFTTYLSFFSLFVYILSLMIAKVFSAYYLGKWILKDKIDNDSLILVISVTVLYLAKLIPYIGGLVGFVTLCLGLGIFLHLLLLLKDKKEN